MIGGEGMRVGGTPLQCTSTRLNLGWLGGGSGGKGATQRVTLRRGGGGKGLIPTPAFTFGVPPHSRHVLACVCDGGVRV